MVIRVRLPVGSRDTKKTGLLRSFSLLGRSETCRFATGELLDCELAQQSRAGLSEGEGGGDAAAFHQKRTCGRQRAERALEDRGSPRSEVPSAPQQASEDERKKRPPHGGLFLFLICTYIP